MEEEAAGWLQGRYEVLEVLGVGGEARVVKAVDHRHDRVVALKVRWAGDEEARQDLLREARVLLNVPPHPALPLVREDFFSGDDYVVAMDWVDGVDLGRLLEAQGGAGMAPSSVLAYLAQAAEALTFLHTQQPAVFHGDVKPSNLVLTRGGALKLVDFGTSSMLGVGLARAGTPGFRAPEIAAGEPPSRASDVYSLAATAFALLTGAPPAGVLPAWEGFDDRQARLLETVLRDGLATDPARRPATAGEFVERLRAGWGSTLPTGVTTFCMTDVVGSTALWAHDPVRMAEQLVRHDRLVADAVERHGGRFIKSMGEGDSTVSVFPSAVGALEASLAVVQVLQGEPWPDDMPITVRVGLHTGEAEQRDADYFGTAVNLSARVRGAAGAEEIVVSSATAAVVREHVPPGYSLVALGPHRLKGVPDPEELFAVAGPGLPTVATAGSCPYRGLLAFGAEDRSLFFGREDVVAKVLPRLRPGSLTVIVGASGSGKSSLLGAGVVGAVAAGEVPGLRAANVLTPGAQPPTALDLAPDELLVVDQFEELYTQCDDEARRAAFIDELMKVPGAVALGVRADFYGELAATPELAAALVTSQVVLEPMREDDLRRAIEEPARRYGLTLEGGLVDLVLRDVQGEPGALPLMSHALRVTWERRNGRALTLAAYEETGGVSSAVAQSADAVAGALPPHERALLRGVLLRLTGHNDGAEDVRRRVRIEDLVPRDVDPAAVRSVLGDLADARLLTLDDDTAQVAHEVLIRRWPTLREWLEEDRDGWRLHQRLGDAARLWVTGGRDDGDLYRGTRLDAAVEWAAANPERLNESEREFLDAAAARAAHEQQAERRTSRRLRRLLAVAGGLLFVAAGLLGFALISRHDAVDARADAESRELAQQADSQLSVDPQRSLLLAREALARAPTAAAKLAATRAIDATTLRAQLPAIGGPACGAQFALLDGGRRAAVRACDELVFQDLLRGRVVRRVPVGGQFGLPRPSPSGKVLYLTSGRDVLRVGVRSGRVQRVFRAPFDVFAADPDPSGRRLAVADLARVLVVDRARGTARTVARGDGSVNQIGGGAWLSPHRLLLVSYGSSSGSGDIGAGVTEVDLRSGARRVISLADDGRVTPLTGVAVSPDRRTWFVCGAEIDTRTGDQVGTVWAIDAATRRVRWKAAGPQGPYATAVGVSPDGSLVGVGYAEGTSEVLDAGTGARLTRQSSAGSLLTSVAFTDDARLLVTGQAGGLIRTYAVATTQRLRTRVPRAPVIGFARGGKQVLAIGERGRALRARGGGLVRSFTGFPARRPFNDCQASCVATSPTLRYLTYLEAAGGGTRVVEQEGMTGRRLMTYTARGVLAAAPAPGGRVVAVAVDGTRMRPRLVSRTGRVIGVLEPVAMSAGSRSAITPSFSRDGRFVAVADSGSRVTVWDLRSRRVVQSVESPVGASGAPPSLSPDGATVFLPLLGGNFLRADRRRRTQRLVPTAGSDLSASALTPDGRFYAVGRYDGSIALFDAATLRVVRTHDLGQPVAAVAFSRDSSQLAATGTRGLLEAWDTCDVCDDADELARRARKLSVRSLSEEEKRTFGIG